jgi:hypothetical protein
MELLFYAFSGENLRQITCSNGTSWDLRRIVELFLALSHLNSKQELANQSLGAVMKMLRIISFVLLLSSTTLFAKEPNIRLESCLTRKRPWRFPRKGFHGNPDRNSISRSRSGLVAIYSHGCQYRLCIN